MTLKQLILTRWTAVCLFITIITMIILIGSGLFDPKPVGSLQWQKSLTQTIPAQSQQITWLGDVPAGDFSVRVTAVYQSGELDSQYGLIIGQDDDYLAITVSPTGYAAIWQQSPVRPFAPWPHVQMGNAPNEIGLDRVNGRVTIRINREILWQGEVQVIGEVGVFGESWGKTAVIRYPSIQLYYP
jgi:hypothetical protein